MQRLKPLQKGQFGSKIKNTKNMRKPILQEHYSCSVQKTGCKNSKYSRKGKILKIGQPAKAIAHAKAIDFSERVSLGQKLKIPKTCENPSYKNIKVVLCKKPLEKPANIREMAKF